MSLPASDPLAVLDHAISHDRFGTYKAAAGGDVNLARKLYIWDRDVAIAVLSDIAILEVAFRNAMHAAATRQWGPHWYADWNVVLDDRSTNQLRSAWKDLPNGVQRNPNAPTTPGKLVARCMLGFWVNLLDAGDHTGPVPRRYRVDYEDLWRAAFSKAFRGGRVEARKENSTFTREWVHGVAKNVNTLRNRAAHHEPLIKGLPLPGQGTRMTVQEGHDQCMLLARMLDRNLAAWLAGNTQVSALLHARPDP